MDFIFTLLLIALGCIGVAYAAIWISETSAYKIIYKRFIENPRCHRCDKVCEKYPIGLGNEFLFVCPDVKCKEPSE